MSTANQEQPSSVTDGALSDELLAPALDAVDKPIALVGTDGVVRHVNRAWALMLSAYGAGLSAWGPGANLIPAWRSAFPDETADKVTACFRAVADGASDEERVVAPFGTESDAPSSRLRMTGLGGDDARTVFVTYDLWIPTGDTPESVHDESEAAAESERLFRFLADAAPFMVWTTDAEHALNFVNRAWCEFTGRAAEDDLGEGWHASVPEDDSDRLARQFRKALATRKPVQLEYPHRRHDGQYRWLLEAARPRFRNDGTFLGYIGTSIDITERKETERQLRESEELFRSAFDNAAFALALLGPDEQVVRINRGAETIFGTDRDALQGRHSTEFVHPEDRDAIDAAFDSLITGDVERYRGQHRFVRAAGDAFWGELTASPIRRDDGAIRYVLVIVEDVTERHGAVEALRASESRLQLIADSLPVLVSKVGADLRYEFANRRYFDWYGVEPELMRGLPMKDFFGDVVWPQIEGYVQRALAGETVSFEWSAPKLGGGTRHQVSDYVPSRDADGKVDGFVVLVTDVSESRAAADRIRELNEELEQRVRARTARLIAVNEELEEFCASVSHDLRQPLRGMEGFSQILIDGYAERLDEEGVDYLARIRQASRRMGRLIDELLELSRLTRGDLQRTPVDLSALAEKLLSELREREPRRTVTTRVQPGIEAVGDAALLEDMLRNLLSNAWKFTRHEEHAEIGFDVEDNPAGPIYVVRDNGVGFDMRYAGKLFAAFQRLHGPEEFEGDGIGLATAARIVGRHGGRIWANAVEDEGATFSFTLSPAPEATDEPTDEPAGRQERA